MKRLIHFALCLLLLSVGHAQTLTKIVIDPPTQGFVIPPGSTTAQLTAQCLNNTTVITCPTLTWGVNYPSLATVSSSGLVTTTNNVSATITSWSITSNVLTVIANNSYAAGNLLTLRGSCMDPTSITYSSRAAAAVRFSAHPAHSLRLRSPMQTIARRRLGML